ncbi:MAG: deoxyribonuclease IV [Candidatus Micrarchaeota archaeon]|nr:deoxyribonuclease IV [Candidatus Micrarchaeota archaeon]
MGGAPRIGYHVSIAGTYDLALDRAKEIGCTCMQIFPSNPRGWAVKELSEKEMYNFRAKAKAFDINPVFVHMPYLPNLASPKDDVYAKSKEAMIEALSRCNALGARYLIVHLGSHLGLGAEAGRERVAAAVNEMERHAGNATILLENEAGQRNSVGSKLDELVDIYNRVGHKQIGFCLDTCHVFAAGYDISKREVAQEVTDTLGMERIHCLHLNDAKYPLGSGLDRHADIGFGRIGRSGFENFFKVDGMKEKPMIMETPLVETPRDAKGELALVKRILEP